MKQRLTRLLSIELNNFKNVNNGFIEMPSLTAKQYDSQNSEILGIYGQNGSGKTAVIDALQFLKEILLGNPLPQNAHNYINVLNEKSSLSFEFYISNNNFESIVNYEFTISKKDENAAFISSEAIKFSKINEGDSIDSKITLIKYINKNGKFVYSPKYRYEQLASGSKETDIKIKTLQALIDREILTKVDENNFRFTSIYTKAVKVKKSTTSSSSHNKTNNQDFGKYFEYCICIYHYEYIYKI